MIHVPPRGPGDKGRIALASVTAGAVEMLRPKRIAGGMVSLSLGRVEIRELNPPAGVKLVRWRLLTTLPTK